MQPTDKLIPPTEELAAGFARLHAVAHQTMMSMKEFAVAADAAVRRLGIPADLIPGRHRDGDVRERGGAEGMSMVAGKLSIENCSFVTAVLSIVPDTFRKKFLLDESWFPWADRLTINLLLRPEDVSRIESLRGPAMFHNGETNIDLGEVCYVLPGNILSGGYREVAMICESKV